MSDFYVWKLFVRRRIRRCFKGNDSVWEYLISQIEVIFFQKEIIWTSAKWYAIYKTFPESKLVWWWKQKGQEREQKVVIRFARMDSSFWNLRQNGEGWDL